MHVKLSWCRVGFAYDIEMEAQKIRADIDRMQRQLELFDNSSTVTSAYTQMHAIEADGFASMLANTDRSAGMSAQTESELQPFLFVGVLSVAGNAGRANAAACIILMSKHPQIHYPSPLCNVLMHCPLKVNCAHSAIAATSVTLGLQCAAGFGLESDAA